MENRKPRFIGWYNEIAIRIYQAGEREWTCEYATTDRTDKTEVDGQVVEITIPAFRDCQTYTSADIAKRETLAYAQNRMPGLIQEHIEWRDLSE